MILIKIICVVVLVGVYLFVILCDLAVNSRDFIYQTLDVNDDTPIPSVFPPPYEERILDYIEYKKYTPHRIILYTIIYILLVFAVVKFL